MLKSVLFVAYQTKRLFFRNYAESSGVEIIPPNKYSIVLDILWISCQFVVNGNIAAISYLLKTFKSHSGSWRKIKRLDMKILIL